MERTSDRVLATLKRWFADAAASVVRMVIAFVCLTAALVGSIVISGVWVGTYVTPTDTNYNDLLVQGMSTVEAALATGGALSQVIIGVLIAALFSGAAAMLAYIKITERIAPPNF